MAEDTRGVSVGSEHTASNVCQWQRVHGAGVWGVNTRLAMSVNGRGYMGRVCGG